MSVDHFGHGLLCPGECCVGNHIDPTDESEVIAYGECLPAVAHHITTNGTLDDLALVINCKAVVAEDGAQFMHDVWLVLSVVPDEHCCQVRSARNVVGREGREGVMRSHIYIADTILLDFETSKNTYHLMFMAVKLYLVNTLSQKLIYSAFIRR